MKSIVSIICTIMVLICMHSDASCQSSGDFQTHQTGNWNTTSTWERWDGSTWVTPAPNTPTSSDGVITILNGHTVTVTANVTVDQVTVNSGGQISVNTSIILTVADGTGTDLTMNGTLAGAGTLTCNGSDIANGGAITVTWINFSATGAQSISGSGTWTGSNITIGGSSNTSIANSMSFGITGTVTVSSGGTLTVSNPLTVSGANFTNSGTVSISSTLTFNGGAGKTFNNGASSAVSGGGTIQTQGTVYLTQNGTFSASFQVNSGTTKSSGTFGGTITVDAGATLTVNASSTLTANNNVTINGTLIGDWPGTFVSNGSTFTNNGAVDVNLYFTFNGSTFINNGTIASAVTFNKPGAQSLSGTGTWTNLTIANSSSTSLSSDVTLANSPLTLNTGTTLSLGSYNLTKTGSTISNSGTISGPGIFKTQGNVTLTQSGTFSAPLQVLSGTTTTSNTFGGTITVDAGATLTVNASATLTANDNITINGTLIGGLPPGTFISNGTTFTNNGTIGTNLYFPFNSSTFNNNGSIYSNVTFNKSGSQSLIGTGSFSPVTATIASGSTVTLGSDHQMGKVTINSGGAMDISSRTLSLSGSGTPLTNNGTFTTTGSTIVYNGTAAQTVATTNISYNNLTINNTAGVTLSSAKSVPGTLTLTNGTFTLSSTLTLGNGATISRATGSLSGTPTFGTSVNVIYTGSSGVTTGTELPSSTTILNDLTINNSGGVTLNASRTVNGTLTLTSGAFGIGTNTLTLIGAVSVTGGSLTSSATGTVNYNQGTNGQNVIVANYGNLTFSNFNKTIASSGIIGIAGTLTSGTATGHTITGSTVEYNGTGAQVLPSGFTTYNNLTLNNAAGTTGFSGLIVNGTMRVQAGAFTSASTYSNVQIDNGATLACSGSSTINVAGTWTNNGTFTASSGTVVFNGSSAQTIGGSNESTFNNFEINNSSGVTLNMDATINSTLTLTSGKITLGSNTFTIGSSGSISGASSSKYIVTDGLGKLTRNGVGGSDVSFPVGPSSSSYNPAIINNSGTSDNFSVKVKVGFDNAPYNSNYVNRQWTITEAVNGGSNTMIKHQWNTADENTGFVRTDPIYIGRWTGSAWVQTSATYTDLGGGVYTAHASGFDTFAPFGIGNDGALPVELTSFSATLKSNQVHLKWRTATEVNNYGFDVERTTPLSTSSEEVGGEARGDWKKIGFVEGHGTVNTPQSYSLIDQLSALDVMSNSISYRLKQIDRDGKYTYSNAVNVTLNRPQTFSLEQNYPNPFSKSSQGSSFTNIPFALQRTEKVSLVVYDVLGNVLSRLLDGVTLDSGNHVFTFFGNGLPAGMYVYELRTESGVLRKQMILER